MRNSYYSKFYKETKSLFPFFGKSEKAYLRQYQSEIDTYLEEFPDSSYNDMKERIGKLKERNFRLKRKGTGNVRMLIKGNPTMVSPKYADAFNQLKGYLADFEEKRKGKK